MCFFIRCWDVVLTYTVMIAEMDIKCFLKNSSYMFVNVWRIWWPRQTTAADVKGTQRACVGKPVGLKTSWLVQPLKTDSVTNYSCVRPAIVYHLYWTAASTPDGNPAVMEAKWRSLINHIQDIHDHETPAFSSCAHPPPEGDQQDKEWLEPGIVHSMWHCACFWIPMQDNLMCVSIEKKIYIQDCLRKFEYCDKVLYFL